MAKKAATKSPRKKAAKKVKQTYMPGMEPVRIPAIDKAAAEYQEVRDERMELTEREIASKELLRKLMLKENITVYKVPDEPFEVVLLAGDPDVKVRKVKQASENGASGKKARAEV